jgi:hypothetical protein
MTRAEWMQSFSAKANGHGNGEAGIDQVRKRGSTTEPRLLQIAGDTDRCAGRVQRIFVGNDWKAVE